MLPLRQLLRYFVRGCLALAPVALTGYIVYLLLAFADDLVPISIPGLGILIAVVVITAVGFLTSNAVGRTLLAITDRMLARVPFVKLIYASLKDLIGAFADRKRFRQPVALLLTPDASIRTLGFITRADLTALGYAKEVAVYLPQSYNFAGNLVIVPRDRVELVDASASEVMTFIVSGGVSGLGAPAPNISATLPAHVPAASVSEMPQTLRERKAAAPG